MPLKTCTCGAKCGVRTKKCKTCGHDFAIKQTQRSTAEPGNWVLEPTGKQPSINPPEELPRGRKLNVGEVAEYIAHEGLGYCIHVYITPGRIQDPQLAKLWGKAKTALRDITAYIEEDQIQAKDSEREESGVANGDVQG